MYTYMNTQGGDAISFSQVSGPEPARTELVERKSCEGLCGGSFYRPVPASAREGETVCAPCKVKLAEWEEMARPATAMASGRERRERFFRRMNGSQAA